MRCISGFEFSCDFKLSEELYKTIKNYWSNDRPRLWNEKEYVKYVNLFLLLWVIKILYAWDLNFMVYDDFKNPIIFYKSLISIVQEISL